MQHYYIVKLTLPTVTSSCLIGTEKGYNTPLTCDLQTTTSTFTHKFTDFSGIIQESSIWKCLTSVSEATPELKAGIGLASIASATINIEDFIADPNPTSEALVENPAIAQQGTFFGKLNARNIITNRDVVIEFWQQSGGVDTLLESHNYLATELKKTGRNKWQLRCKDVLYKTDPSKSQFPAVVTGNANAALTDTATSITFQGDVADWSTTNHVAVMGTDVMLITNAVDAGGGNVTLTVTRSGSITIGSRTYSNDKIAHESGDEVFRGRKYIAANLEDIIFDIWGDSGIDAAYWNATNIGNEIDSWIPSATYDCMFITPKDANDVLDEIASTFLIDMFAAPDAATQADTLQVAATNPWSETTSVLVEGQAIVTGSLKIESPDKLQYTRALLQYDKRTLSDDDEDTSYKRSSQAIDTSLEGALFLDEIKQKRMAKSTILASKSRDIEIADAGAVRFVNRFSSVPKIYTFNVDEKYLDFALSNVIEIQSDEVQGFDGLQKGNERAQIVNISPRDKIGRLYRCKAISYNPFAGGDEGGGHIYIYSTSDINLYSAAGAPPSAGTYYFVIDGNDIGHATFAASIIGGSWQSGSIIHLILINGATVRTRGGAGGRGASIFWDFETVSWDFITSSGLGSGGGTCFDGTSGSTFNIYLSGARTIDSIPYTCDGYLLAAGGGGGGGNGAGTTISNGYGGGGGGGGAGNPVGVGGSGGVILGGGGSGTDGASGTSGTALLGGTGGFGGISGADGGDEETGGSSSSKAGGSAGKGIVLNGSTINIYGTTAARFKNGTGDTPSSTPA